MKNNKHIKIFDPKNDYIFKRIFGHDKEIFINFVNSIFEDKREQKIKSIIFTNTEIPKDALTDKACRLDVRATLDDDTIINIEVQIRNEDGFEKRTLYYWSKLYEEQIESGDDYLELKRTVCINVLNYTQFKKHKNFHSIYGVTNLETNERLTNDFEVHFLELPKLIENEYNKSKRMSQLKKWLLFLKAPTEKVLEDLSMHDPIIAKATKTLKYLSQDPEARAIYEARRRYELDMNTAIHAAESKGALKEKLAIAKKLKKLGVPTKTIMEASDLSKEEIDKI